MIDVEGLVPKYPSTDRLVKARKWRRCQRHGCGRSILSGQFYLDVDPPMRENGYFATCVPCAVEAGLLVRRGEGTNDGR